MKIYQKYLLALGLFFAFGSSLKAQVSPMGNMYFYNQYLGNPAMAGLKGHLNLNLLYRKQFNQIPNAPTYQVFTGEYAHSDKTAFGLNVDLSKRGLMNSTRVMGTYAYHLPISQSGKLSFGISAGVRREHIDVQDITAEINDPVVDRFNDKGYEFDGDLGIAYTNKNLNIQATLLNLNNHLNTDPNLVLGINYATFFSAVSYQIVANELIIEPKLVYRGIKGMDNIVEGGIGLNYQEQFSVFGLYHSNNSATIGAGFNHDKFKISAIYSIGPSAVRSFTGGDFEIGLGVLLDKKK